MKAKTSKVRGFSLVELVIVIVILGVIAAIAIPRISSGSKNAGEAALRANLQSIRNAIDWYYGEHHNTFPGANGDGTNAAGTQEAFLSQLLAYSDASGNTSTTKDAAHPYGPYLRSPFPKLPVGQKAGNGNILVSNTTDPLAPDVSQDAGWVYSTATGQFIANCAATEVGADSVPYYQY